MHSIIQLLLITSLYNQMQSSYSSSFVRSNVFLDPLVDMNYIQINFSHYKHNSIAYLDFTNKYSTIKENRRYNTEQPTTIKRIIDTNTDNEVDTNKYALCWDEVYIEDKQVKSFPFLLEIAFDSKNYDDFPIHSTVSLSRSKYSLMNLLYDSGIISKRVMRFKSFNIELGENPNTNTNNNNDYNSYVYIPLINNTNDSNLWSTDLIGVITGVMPNLTFINNTHQRIAIDINNYTHFDHSFPLTFDAKEIGIVFPEAYIDFFYFDFFELFISLHKCFLKKRDKAKVFECDKTTMVYFDDLFIFFDGIMVKFETKELFYSINERTVVSKISFREELTSVVMGMEYILTKALVFNEDEGVIGFQLSEYVYPVDTNFNYTTTFNRINNKEKDTLRSKSFGIVIILFLICFVLLLGIALLVILKKIQIK